MNKVLPFVMLLYHQTLPAQSLPCSKEAFVNAVDSIIIDSRRSGYYLLEEACPCSFRKYNYDEWVKYGLREKMDFSLLNELSKNAYEDKAPGKWDQAKLRRAKCISKPQARALLNPLQATDNPRQSTTKQEQRKLRKQWRRWYKQPVANRLVYYFSKPGFSDDLHYAVMDFTCRCDDKECGMSATYIFQRKDRNWEVAGELIKWEN
jgi:hypothetical protein